MKKLITFIILLISVSGFSQHWNKVYSYNEYLGLWSDSVLHPPGDTLASAPIGSFAIKNNHVYQKLSTGIWSQVDGGGNAVQSLTGSQSIQYGPFNSMPSPGTSGRFYAATDSSRWYFDNGIAWLNLSGSGGGVGGAILTFGTGLVAGSYNGSTPVSIIVDTNFMSTRQWRQKGLDSLQIVFNALLALKKNLNDSAATSSGGYVTQASRQKLSDSLQAVMNALLALKKNLNDSAATSPSGYVTQASRQKIVDSLMGIINGKMANFGASAGIKAGTFLSRPSAASLSQSYYWSTDSVFYSYSDGSIWHDLKPGTNGISHVIRKAATDSVFYDSAGTTKFSFRDTLLSVKPIPTGLISVDSSLKVGTIYDSASWSNLNYFTNIGSNFSISGGKITTSNYSTGSGVIQFPYATMLDQEHFEFGYKYLTHNSTSDFGLDVFWNSIGNVSQSKADLAFYLSIHSGSMGQAVIVSVINGTSTNYTATGNITTINNGDSITYVIDRTPYGVVFTATDVTQGTSATNSIPLVYNYPGSGVSHNTAMLQIYTQSLTASTVEIDHIKWTSNQPQFAQAVIRGNSIDNGSFAGSVAGRASNLVHFVDESGAGDVSNAYVATIHEIIYLLKPKVVYIKATANDIAFGIASATWQANFTTVHDSLVAHGILVKWITPTPRNAIDVTPINTWLTTTWGVNNVIDLYTPLKGSGTSLNAAYNAGDGIHITPSGNALMASVIKADTSYQRLANGYYVSYVADPGLDSTKNLGIVNVGFLKQYVAQNGTSGISGLTPGTIPVAVTSGSLGNSPLITSSGKVGFGVTPNYPLDLGGYSTTGAQARYGDFLFQSFNSGNNYIFNNAQNVSGVYQYVNTGAANLIAFSGGIFFGTAPSGSAGTTLSAWTPGLYIVTNGHSLFNTLTDSGTAQVQINGNLKTKADSTTSSTGGFLYRDFATGIYKITAAPSGGSSFYQTVQSNTTSQTQRTKLNFLPPFQAADNSGNTSTDISLPMGNLTSPTITAGAGAGTSPTISNQGFTLSGRLQVITGTSPTASSAVITVTLGGSQSFSSTGPIVTLTPANAAAAALSGTAAVSVDHSGTTQWIITVGSTALAASTTYAWNYFVTGY